jgi:hypothetical protein
LSPDTVRTSTSPCTIPTQRGKGLRHGTTRGLTTATMEPVVKEVVDEASGACATFQVSAEAPDARAQRYAGGGGSAPQVWIPDSTLLADCVARDSGGRVTVREPVAATPVLLAVPTGQRVAEPTTWGSTIVAENTRLPDPNTSTLGRSPSWWGSRRSTP